MKKRNFQDIEVSKITKTTEKMVFNHLVGEMQVNNSGGAYVYPIPCGAGKTTLIVNLIVTEATESFVVFVKTRQECRDLYEKLISHKVNPTEILMIYSPSPEEEKKKEDYDNNPGLFGGNYKIAKHTERAKDAYKIMTDTPEKLPNYRVLIITSIHLSTNFLPALLNYIANSDLEKLVGKEKELLCNGNARKYIVLDELPEHIKAFKELNGRDIASHFGVMSATGDSEKDIQVGSGYLKLENTDKMKSRYSGFLSNSKKCYFFGRRCRLNILKSYELLNHLRANFKKIGEQKSYLYYHILNDILSEPRSMKSCVFLFDATADVISPDWKGSKFNMIQDKKNKKYCSPIEFKPFYIDLRRWNNSASGIEKKVPEIANILETQIRHLAGGKLLIVTWKDMELYGKDEDYTEKDVVNISELLEKELSGRGLCDTNGDPLYSIIYRGSGQDKATNAYKDFAGITFLGEWKCKNPHRLLNKTFGLKIKEIDLRLAWMIQTCCRIRIRNHNQDPITIFYTEDIDQLLMGKLQDYFIENTDPAFKVFGVPKYVASQRDQVFISRVRILLEYDQNLLSNLKSGSGYVCSIPLNTLSNLLKIGKCGRSSYRGFKKKLLTEYGVTLKIT